ncbi:MAG: hypothetical protein DMG54_18430 [Acidobacteria bacterium]|nr:MAG: hypothetical protein DMG53_21460 [Acidobacteriota bacterium]PYU41828.1 MAG: hypothetical protein DMG54_18430 [Acidobacteriota bacterium]PYU75269.1 MAG: hypothetical protein DMG52_08915 [Acidobacteriota bacterium]
MLRRIPLRLGLPVVLSLALLPAAVFAQSEDAPSVAEAARRAREQKKTQAKPAKVITEDDVKPVARPNSATPAPPEAATASAAPAPPASSTASTASSSSPAPDAKDQKDSKEVTELKAQIKQVQGDLDLLQREQSLEQDKYYSNTDYLHDTAGKAKLEALKQQVSDKQQELEHLKTRLAALQPTESGSTSTPSKP